MGTHIVYGLQMVHMPDQSQHLKTPVVQAKKCTDAHIIDPCLLGTIKGGNPPVVILLYTSGVIQGIGTAMISLLKYLVSPDSRIQNCFESLNIKRSSIDINTPYLPVTFLYFINCFDSFGNKFRGIFGVFPVDKDQAFLSHFLQHLHLLDQFRMGQCSTLLALIGSPEATIFTVIDAKVSHVQGCKQDNPLSVYLFLQLSCASLDFFNQFRIGGIYQNSSFLHGEPFFT